jgi:predicted Zn-dependent peptidase
VFEEVRVKRNLSYAPDAFLRTQAANVGGIYVTAVDANQSVRVMLNEISRLQTELVGVDDIQAVVAQYLTNYYLGQETNLAQAGELAQAELIGGGWRNSVDFFEKLEAVTPGDIQRVSRSTCGHSVCRARQSAGVDSVVLPGVGSPRLHPLRKYLS